MVRILRFQEGSQIGFFIICKPEARGIHGKFHAVQRHLQLIRIYGFFEQRRSLLRRLAGQVDAVQLRAVQKRAQRLRLRRGLRFLLPLAGAGRQNQHKQQRHDRTASDDSSHSESSFGLFFWSPLYYVVSIKSKSDCNLFRKMSEQGIFSAAGFIYSAVPFFGTKNSVMSAPSNCSRLHFLSIPPAYPVRLPFVPTTR